MVAWCRNSGGISFRSGSEFRNSVEICRSGELPVLFEDGEGGLEANRWRSFGVGEDLLDVGECEACEHRDLRAELFLELGVGGFDGFEEEGILGPVVGVERWILSSAATAGISSPKPRAMAAAAWMGVKLVSKFVDFEEGED